MEELTVENALKELREMFPGDTVQADTSAWHWDKDGDSDTETDAKIAVGFGRAGGDKTFYAATLNEAMSQVRAWKESQSKSEPAMKL